MGNDEIEAVLQDLWELSYKDRKRILRESPRNLRKTHILCKLCGKYIYFDDLLSWDKELCRECRKC
jgi:hypothetical protein